MWDAFTGYDVRYHYLKCTGEECEMFLLDMTTLSLSKVYMQRMSEYSTLYDVSFHYLKCTFVHVKKMLDDLTGYHVRSIIDLYEYIALYRPFIIWHIYKIFMSAVWISLGSFSHWM